MKIAYISNSVIPSRSANSLQVMKMCEAFVQRGYEVTLLAPSRPSEYEKVGNTFDFYGINECFKIKKLRYPRLRGRRQIYALLIAKELNTIKPDLAYGRFIFGCYFSAKLGYKTVFESHIAMEQRSRLERWYIRRLANCANFERLVVISHAQKAMYLREGILPENKIQVAHSGADEVNDFKKLTDWPSRKGVLQVGYAGQLYKGKGAELIVNLSKQLPSIDFHIIGGMEDDIRQLKKYVNNNNIFFHGHVAPREVYRYRNSCDILCAPYQAQVSGYGGRGDISKFMSPMKVFEYMASKRAIIASDLPVVREVLNEKNAILVNPECEAEWVQAINRLRDQALRKKLVQIAYQDFINLYTWTKRAKLVLGSFTSNHNH